MTTAMVVQVGDNVPDDVREDLADLTDVCPVCGKILGKLPYTWIVFNDLATTPQDWFVHPECSDELLSGKTFTHN